MKNILQEIFYQEDFKILTNNRDPEILQRIATNSGMLKKDFNKWQKKILLRIIDDNDLLACNRANDNFISGVRYGVMFMIEALYKGGGIDG